MAAAGVELELMLFNGTSAAAVGQICTRGLDRGKAGKNGNLCSQNQNSDMSQNTTKYVVVLKFLVGQVYAKQARKNMRDATEQPMISRNPYVLYD